MGTKRRQPLIQRCVAAVILLATTSLPLAQAQRPKPRAAEVTGDNCLTSGCHDGLSKTAFIHAPVAQNQCGQCHRPADAEQHTFALTSEEPALCHECHDADDLAEAGGGDASGQLVGHAPFTAGQCLTCHNPHGGDEAQLLRHGGKSGLCMECHDGDVELSGRVHAPIERSGCTACHRGHQSAYAKLMRFPPAEACVSCHSKTMEQLKTAGNVHRPAGALDCQSCHKPHASTERALLGHAYSAKTYVPVGQREQYALCFECHDAELLEEAETDATGFRNGMANLHHLHVNKDTKGRSCHVCHESHAGAQSRLIRDTLTMGQWRTPLRFRETPTGGSCGPACHAAKEYDRESPVEWNTSPPMLTEPERGLGDVDRKVDENGESPR
ncbi:MAG: hypothetical protein HOP29_17600 [Phycisphaerales bacterium]|nr:hypothetical protein [Phycisphaerales bacterium]